MKNSLPHGLGRTCIVLGAGATRGSSLAKGGAFPLPPLDSDFFTQIQRIKNRKYHIYISRLLKYCFLEFGPSWELSMEGFFNHLWYSKTFLGRRKIWIGDRRKRSGPLPETRSRKYKYVDDVFRQVFLGVLEESLFGEHSGNVFDQSCIYHNALARSLDPDDSIISFNYDCVADVSLANYCQRWNPQKSYGFQPYEDENVDYWRRRGTRNLSSLVKLYKLHGSVNWQQKGQSIRLTQKPYTRMNSDRDFFIVPPVLSKELWMSDELESVWGHAASSLDNAASIIIIGYSLPEADALATELFRTRSRRVNRQDIKKPSLRYLISVDPIKAIRKKHRDIFRSSLSQQTRILSFDTLEEFSKYLFSKDQQFLNDLDPPTNYLKIT
ncbi:MAG: SIR2 family protein [Phycisphaeraceae bacterium]